MKVSDVMTFGAATVSADAPLAEAAQTLLNHRISGLPVVSSAGELVGVLTEGDIVRSIAEHSDRAGNSDGHAGGPLKSLPAIRVEDAMTSQVQAIDGDCPVDEAARMIVGRGSRALPVTSSGKIVGILSRPDLIRYLLGKRS